MITSELGVSARIGSLGTYAAKITAAVVNDNIVSFFYLNFLTYLFSNRYKIITLLAVVIKSFIQSLSSRIE